jgi:predicted O-methyltransferase YrrM
MDIEGLLNNIPLLHVWDGKANTGGFDKLGLRALYDLARSVGSPKVLETGAGNSSLAFMLAGAVRLISICPEQPLFERIRAFTEKSAIDASHWQPITMRSEICLPKLVDLQESFDIVLIDGGHGWPTVFVDFCYCHMLLREGGVLIVDDHFLYSVSELINLLLEQPEYEFRGNLSVNDKTLIFKKKAAGKFFPEWAHEPYIKRRTDERRAARANDTSRSK